MKIEKITLSLMLGLLLVGCDSRIDAVNEQMASIRNQPPLPIEPAPVFAPVPTFNYSAHQLKSPFLPGSLAAELQIMAGKRVYPNQTGQVLALIQTPDGEIERIQLGSYMGVNHGRVVKITPTQIDLVEIIPDGREGYVERPRSLILIGPAP